MVQSYLKALPSPIAHELRRARFRLTSPASYQELQRYRSATDNSGLRPFDELATIFVQIPKCAGTSVSTSLFGRSVGGHHSISYFQLVFPWVTFQKHFKFTIVRNPYDRLVSGFLYLQKGGGNSDDAAWLESNASYFSSFRHFVLNGLKTPEIIRSMHFRPQIEFLRDFRGRIPLDYIGRYEQLDLASAEIFSRLGVDAKLERLNYTRKRQREPFQSYYDDEMRTVVAHVYAEDLRQFGYQFRAESNQ